MPMRIDGDEVELVGGGLRDNLQNPRRAGDVRPPVD
jgi:hypothetical protein